MVNDKKKYLVNIVGKGSTPTNGLAGGPILVHGEEDLKARQKAAKAAGVELTVRPAPKV